MGVFLIFAAISQEALPTPAGLLLSPAAYAEGCLLLNRCRSLVFPNPATASEPVHQCSSSFHIMRSFVQITGATIEPTWCQTISIHRIVLSMHIHPQKGKERTISSRAPLLYAPGAFVNPGVAAGGAGVGLGASSTAVRKEAIT